MSDLSIVISSCNRYHYLWDIQLQLFNKYWSQCQYPIYVVSESSVLPNISTDLKLHNFNVGNAENGPTDWSYMLETVLRSIDSEYILYMQEDYVFTDFVKEEKLTSLLKYVKENKINYLRFYTSPAGNGESIVVDEDVAIKEILPGSQWRSSLMVALWKKDTLLSLLSGLTITPWQFEHLNTDHIDKFYCIDLPNTDSSDVLPFLGMYGSTNGHTFYPMIVDLLNRNGIKKLDGSSIDFNIKL